MYCIKVYRSLLHIMIAVDVSLFTNSIRRLLQRSIYQCLTTLTLGRALVSRIHHCLEKVHCPFSTFGRSKYLAACVLSCVATHLIVLINSSALPTAVDTCCELLIYGSTPSTAVYCESSDFIFSLVHCVLSCQTP